MEITFYCAPVVGDMITAWLDWSKPLRKPYARQK